MRVWSLGQEDPLEEEMAAHSSILPGKSRRQVSLADYSSWGCKELAMTEATQQTRRHAGSVESHICSETCRIGSHLHFKRRSQQVLRAGALGRPRGMGWGGRWERGSGWGTHVNPWLIHVNVRQKSLQYCKVISLQLIKINGGEKNKQKINK